MKKIMTSLVALLIVQIGFAQNVLLDKLGTAHFYSEAPLEDIEATNKKAIGAFDLDKGGIAVSMIIKNFHFDKSLMEEHFNENYLESDKYPKASLKGKIQNFSDLDFSKPGVFTAKIEGDLEIHGVKKPLVCDVNFEVNKEVISVKTKFQVALKDHNIEIPTIVIRNIAEVVDVDASFNFVRK